MKAVFSCSLFDYNTEFSVLPTSDLQTIGSLGIFWLDFNFNLYNQDNLTVMITFISSVYRKHMTHDLLLFKDARKMVLMHLSMLSPRMEGGG